MLDYLNFILKRVRERLWVRPLFICALSIVSVFLANTVEMSDFGRSLPKVPTDATEALLRVMASSMLVMATLAVTSMVSAYASASNSATPRSFPLIISDDVSQNAFSAFVGAFIYSVVALVALMNGLYEGAGSHFVLFSLTMAVLAAVIVTFVRWVDNIARLGRLGHTIEKVEAATAEAIRSRRSAPRLGGVAAFDPPEGSTAVCATSIGYLQRVNVSALQSAAAKSKLRIVVAALPGTFCTPGRPVAWLRSDDSGSVSDGDIKATRDAFTVHHVRVFDQDPRFGLVVLSEIASRALSPSVNDPGTAIGVTGTLVRLFAMWNECGKDADKAEVKCDRVAVPELSLPDLFDDAFTGIARDGAGMVEVVVRLLKALEALGELDDAAMRECAQEHARLVLRRAEQCLTFPPDLAAAREAGRFASRGTAVTGRGAPEQ
ncbi:MAG: DUF2254 domain-containing protein [Planctomycetaceae bacterium]|nr:DUF2254 domain-containing protein [Planctomycetaceae bacterium]